MVQLASRKDPHLSRLASLAAFFSLSLDQPNRARCILTTRLQTGYIYIKSTRRGKAHYIKPAYIFSTTFELLPPCYHHYEWQYANPTRLPYFQEARQQEEHYDSTAASPDQKSLNTHQTQLQRKYWLLKRPQKLIELSLSIELRVIM